MFPPARRLALGPPLVSRWRRARRPRHADHLGVGRAGVNKPCGLRTARRRRRRHARAPSEPASAPALGVGLGSASAGGGGAASGERLLTASALPDRRPAVRVDRAESEREKGRRPDSATASTLPPPPPRLSIVVARPPRDCLGSWRAPRRTMRGAACWASAAAASRSSRGTCARARRTASTRRGSTTRAPPPARSERTAKGKALSWRKH